MQESGSETIEGYDRGVGGAGAQSGGTDSALSPGQVIGGEYRIARPLGGGGFSRVYLAWHLNLRKHVMVKQMRGKNRRTAMREMEILRDLNHPHIPRIYDCVSLGQDIYLVMDYVDGETMEELIRRRVPVSEAMLRQWLEQMLDALACIHEHRPPILHCDIKPANLMIDRQRGMQLIDFNVSLSGEQERQEGLAGLTVSYASPELRRRYDLLRQGRSASSVLLDGRSDLYSLAASFYALMTGRLPGRQAGGEAALWTAQDRSRYSEQLLSVLSRALERDPDRRFANAREMRAALSLRADTSAAEPQEVPVQKAPVQEETAGGRARLVVPVVAAVAVVALVVLLLLGRTFSADFERKSARAAQASEDGSNAQVIALTQELLESPRYVFVRRRNAGQTAELYFAQGGAYLNEKKYALAAGSYERAIQCNAQEPDYYRDYAVALARNHQGDEAEKVLDEAKKKGVEDDGLWEIQGEIAYEREDDEECITQMQKVIEKSSSEELLTRACLLCGRSYARQGDADRQFSLLQEGQERLGGNGRVTLLREEGSARVRLLDQTAEANGGSLQGHLGEVQEAQRIYAELSDRSDASFADQYGNVRLLMTIAQLQESESARAVKYDEVLSVLEKLAGKYPKRYEIPMEQGTALIGKLQAQGDENADYSAAVSYQKRAQDLGGTVSDPGMRQLSQLIADLQREGYRL